MQLDLERNGVMNGYVVPDSIPSELDGFPWPAGIAEAVAASDAAYLRLSLAVEEWRDASDALQHSAPKQDDDALRAALRAGKGDPGTKATDKARRGEHVAWTALHMALEECAPDLADGRNAVSEYLSKHRADLAVYELDRLAEYRATYTTFAAARAAMYEALGQTGNASRVMTSFLATRWDDTDRLALTWLGPDDYLTHDSDIEAKWKALARNHTWPPPVDIRDKKASELATAVRFGNAPDATAELRRRRKESHKAATT